MRSVGRTGGYVLTSLPPSWFWDGQLTGFATNQACPELFSSDPQQQFKKSAVLEIEPVDFLLALIEHEQRRIIWQQTNHARPVTT